MSCRVLAVRKWIPCDLPHKSHRRASIERQHGIQQNLCAGGCISLSNRFSLVMAETACARNKDHGSRYDLRDIHSVVAGTTDNFACRKPFFLNAGSERSWDRMAEPVNGRNSSSGSCSKSV